MRWFRLVPRIKLGSSLLLRNYPKGSLAIIVLYFSNMFVLAEMKDTVRVKPWHFGIDLREAIASKLNKKLANKVSRQSGYLSTTTATAQRANLLYFSLAVFQPTDLLKEARINLPECLSNFLEYICLEHVPAKVQNTGPLIYILLNHNSAYCVPLRSSKGFDTCKTGGPNWPCIL